MPPAQPDTSLEDPSPSRRHQVSGRDRVIGAHRVRAVCHAGEVHYDPDGSYGEALDIAFRLLDAPAVKQALKAARDPLVLVVSGDIYSSVVRHGYDGIDRGAFRRLVSRQVAGNRYPGWVQIPGAGAAIA